MSDYSAACAAYIRAGVDPERALQQLAAVPLSLHCWQGDDVGGFERAGSEVGGGLAVTGNYPGKARTVAELRGDFAAALRLVPGRHRINLHAAYADPAAGRVERDALTILHFQSWVDWARGLGLGIDFNPTYFAHPRAESGFTLSHAEASVRDYWIRHGIACRRIAAAIGRQLGQAVITNFWIPDGFKDAPYDRAGPRRRLEASLDRIFAEPLDEALTRDAVESKLFGLGSESYVVGSHEFYLGYAITRRKLVCLDAGHFHPTESLADKISSVLQFAPEILLHVSRGVRWDSDHVVVLDDPLRAMMQEVVRGGWLDRTRIGLDFFDASINRIAAWAVGARSTQKALLEAMLEPAGRLRAAEEAGDYTSRLVLFEAAKTLPFGAVWEEFCRRHDTPDDWGVLDEIKQYERDVLARRQPA